MHPKPSPWARFVGLAPVILAALIQAPLTQAATSTYVGVSQSGVSIGTDVTQVDTLGQDLQILATYDGWVGYYAGTPPADTLIEARRSSLASSSLATASLATVAAAAHGARVSGPAVQPGHRMQDVRASAWMGDTFQLSDANGVPLPVGESANVSFAFDVTGAMEVAGAFIGGHGYNQFATSFQVGVYGIGALDLWRRHDEAMAASDYGLVNALFAQIQGLQFANYRALFLDPVGAANYEGLPVDVFVPSRDVPTAITLEFFAPGRFEWLVRLDSAATLDAAYEQTSLLADFGHTMLARFDAPPEYQVSSASGLFPGTLAPVPEPAAAWLFLAGAGVLGWAGLGRSGRRLRLRK